MWSPFVSTRKRKRGLLWEPPLQEAVSSCPGNKCPLCICLGSLLEAQGCAEDAAEGQGVLGSIPSTPHPPSSPQRSSDSQLHPDPLNKAYIFSKFERCHLSAEDGRTDQPSHRGRTKIPTIFVKSAFYTSVEVHLEHLTTEGGTLMPTPTLGLTLGPTLGPCTTLRALKGDGFLRKKDKWVSHSIPGSHSPRPAL